MKNDRVAALILAGGMAKRMGGVDKGWQPFHGKPMIHYAIESVLPLSDFLMISANRNQDHYATLVNRVVSDEAPWLDIGPLGGVMSALSYLETIDHDFESIILVPCDTPSLSTAALEPLIMHHELDPYVIHCLFSAGRVQPLHAIWPIKGTLEKLTQYLEQTNHFGVMGFYNAFGYCEVEGVEAAELDNINYINQLN